MFCLESVIFLFIFGPVIFPGLVAVILNLLLYTAICFMALKRVLPFSEAFGIKQDDEWSGIALLAVLGGLAGIQIAGSFLWYRVSIDIAVIAAANIVQPLEMYKRNGITDIQ